MPTAKEVREFKPQIAASVTLQVRVLRTIYDRCKPEEKLTQEHRGSDSRGFSEWDMRPACRTHERIKARGWAVMPSEAEWLRENMPRYARQYLQAQEEDKEARKERFRAEARRMKAKREEHPFWGAAKRNSAILDSLPAQVEGSE